jgi:uncharacterized membrane protein
MEKTKINYFIDVLIGILFLITAITGLIIFFFLPSGVSRGSYQTFLGIAKYKWSSLHDYAGIGMIIFTFVHMLLHINWFVCMTKNMFQKKKKVKK